MKITVALLLAVCAEVCLSSTYGRNEGYGDSREEYGPPSRGYGNEDGYGNRHTERYPPRDGYGQQDSYGPPKGYGKQEGNENTDGYGKDTYKVTETYHKTEYKPKTCYQCAYSPPKTYYDRKVYVERHRYGREYKQKDGYGQTHGYGDDKKHGTYGEYVKKTVVPVPYTVEGGWDKCMGPFTHYEAKDFGVDVWDCHSNCYTRKDKNGDIFRGCYKGEYGVDPHKYGCQKQAGSTWCFCEGNNCNNGPAPY